MAKIWQRDGEMIGGGFFVFRRGKTTGRISRGALNTLPFEHPTLDAATAEADRLAGLYPGETFAVFQQYSLHPDLAPTGGSNA